METIVEILELVGLVLVVVWIVKHVEGKGHGGGGGCGCSGPDLSFGTPTGGCS